VKEPIWLTRDEVLAFHEDQLKEHGGLAGVRDESALEGALARPINTFNDEAADLYTLAATYAHGIAKNHPFIDGNKRTAFASAAVFLILNGLRLTLTESHAVEVMLALAAGKVNQAEFAKCIRENSAKIR
jgi:death-on-curing protein